MSVTAIDHVTVIGAGNMGHGIAEVTAIAGCDVTLRAIEGDLVEDGYEDVEWSLRKLDEKGRLDESPEEILSRVDTAVDLEEAVSHADLVVEAAPERMSIEKDLFADLDEYTDEDAILASNTSSLSTTETATATDRSGRDVGTHFFNPPVKTDLVEAIYGEETSDETAETAHDWVESIDRTPIYTSGRR